MMMRVKEFEKGGKMELFAVLCNHYCTNNIINEEDEVVCMFRVPNCSR